jgi:hypothetical protein
MNIRELRIKWGFCPDCGLVPEHPTNAYYHRDKRCHITSKIKKEDSMLKAHHLKYGLSVQEGDHVITLLSPFKTVIARFAIEGIMSAKPIWDAADDYIKTMLGVPV